MTTFSIKIIDEKIRESYGRPCCIGEIKIGNFDEPFEMPLVTLTMYDYRKQWKTGLERILTHDESCLVAELENHQKYPRVIMWVLYKEGNKVYIQNHYLFDKKFLNRLKKQPFNFETCYDFIMPRDRSEEVSEWVTDLDSIKEFLAKNEF